jgi:hypothetical protein
MQWQRPKSYSFARQLRFVPVVYDELRPAAINMPMGFFRRDDAYLLGAVLGLDGGENLFTTADGQWLGLYVPAMLRGYPFRLLIPQGEGPERRVLCIDEDSGLLRDGDGDAALFDEQGDPDPSVKEVTRFLEQWERGRLLVERATATLAEAGVLTPWEIPFPSGEAGKPAVAGLNRIDEAALNALDETRFMGLRRVGALAVAYAQLISMESLSLLPRLQQAKRKAELTPQQGFGSDFGLGSGDETLSF